MTVPRFLTIRHSLFAQMISVMLGAFLGLLLFFIILLQTTLVPRWMPRSFASLAEPVSELVVLLENVTAPGEPSVLSVFKTFGRAARLRESFPPDAEPRPDMVKRVFERDDMLKETLSGRDIRFRYIAPRRLMQQTAPDSASFPGLAAMEISVALTDGRVLSVMFSPATLILSRPGGFLAFLVPAMILIAALTIFLIVQALRPLRELERATEKFGETRAFTSVGVRGAEEIRRVARALNRTQERVNALISERERMVCAVTHDLRTTITRLRLRLDGEKVNREAAAKDLDQMQALIDDILLYSRSAEPSVRHDLIELNDFVSDYARNAPAGLVLDNTGATDRFFVAADPTALTRALNNIVDNAIRYGGSAHLRTRLEDGAFEIVVLDDGPGVPADKLDQLFEPFFRLEASRSRETGGSGLGLGIARGLVQVHGATLTLKNRETGGLTATIRFPASCRVD